MAFSYHCCASGGQLPTTFVAAVTATLHVSCAMLCHAIAQRQDTQVGTELCTQCAAAEEMPNFASAVLVTLYESLCICHAVE